MKFSGKTWLTNKIKSHKKRKTTERGEGGRGVQIEPQPFLKLNNKPFLDLLHCTLIVYYIFCKLSEFLVMQMHELCKYNLMLNLGTGGFKGVREPMAPGSALLVARRSPEPTNKKKMKRRFF